ncbi:hypothetical protein IWX92DRAFT_131016 [Phyllosticta citricarpa]
MMTRIRCPSAPSLPNLSLLFTLSSNLYSLSSLSSLFPLPPLFARPACFPLSFGKFAFSRRPTESMDSVFFFFLFFELFVRFRWGTTANKGKGSWVVGGVFISVLCVSVRERRSVWFQAEEESHGVDGGGDRGAVMVGGHGERGAK